jgi:hypothetical protein
MEELERFHEYFPDGAFRGKHSIYRDLRKEKICEELDKLLLESKSFKIENFRELLNRFKEEENHFFEKPIKEGQFEKWSQKMQVTELEIIKMVEPFFDCLIDMGYSEKELLQPFVRL